MKKLFLKSLAIGMMALIPAMSWAQTAVPYTETFESYSSGLPTGWSKVGSGTVAVVANTNWSTYSHAGTKSLKFSGATSNPVAMPQFAAEISTLQLVFWTKPESNNASCGTFEVGYLTDPSNQFTFVAVETYKYNDNGGAYGEKTVLMPKAPAGSVFAFRHVPTSTSWYWFVDDVQVTVAPTCKKTTNISVSNITSSGATISWNVVDGASAYDVTVGSDVFSGVTDTFKVVTGLSDNTLYNVSVVTDCGGGDKSGERAISFKTKCLKEEITKTIAFTEGFESWSTGSSAAFQDCWNRIQNGTYPYCNNSGANSGSNCMYFYGGGSTTIQYLILPEFANDLSKLHLEFYYKNNNTGTSYGQFAVGTMSDPTDASTFHKIADLTKKTYYEWYSADLTGATAGDSYIAIKYYNGTGSYGYGYIDDIEVSLIPTCIVPTALTFNSATTTSVTFGWTKGKDETKWNVQYKEAGATDWSDVSGVVTSNPYTLTGLQPAASYDVRVCAYCSADDQSVWSDAITVTTKCDAITSFPWSENFESYSNNSSVMCWDRSASTTATASAAASYFVWGVYETAGNKSVRMNNYNVQKGNAVIDMRSMTLPSDKDMAFVFDYCHNASCGAFDVKISTDNGVNFTSIGSFSKNDTQGTYSTPSKWVEGQSISLSAYKGQTIIIRLFAVSDYSQGAIFIDNISVEEASSCEKPTVSENVTLTSSTATFTWTAGGEESQWQYVCVAKGVEPDWANATLTSTASATVSGLSANTEYDFYVRAYCSATSQSKGAKSSFKTECGDLEFDKLFGFEDETSGSQPACWTMGRASYSGTLPTVQADGSTAQYKYAHSGTMSLKMYYNGSNKVKVWAVLPKVAKDVDVSTLQLSAFAYAASNNYAALKIGVMKDPNDFSTFTDCTTSDNRIPCLNTKTSPVSTVNFEAYQDTGKYIAFVLDASSSTVTAYLDDIKVIKKLEKPSNVQISAMETTADVSFTQVNSKGKWEYQLGDAAAVTITSTSFQLIGLSAGEQYSLKIRHIDAAMSDTSSWTTTEFSTTCVAKQLPFTETFSSAKVPMCWTAVSSASNWPSISNGKLYLGQAGAEFLPEMKYTDISGIENAMISFDAEVSSSEKELKVILVADPGQLEPSDLANQTVVGTVTVTSTSQYFEMFIADVPAADRAGKSYLGFYSAASSYIYIDNVKVKVAAYRLPEFGTAVVTASTATIPFTQKDDELGGWIVQYGTDKTFTTKTEISIEAEATKEIALTGLTENTTYYVRIQQAMDEDNTHWAVMSLTTSCAPLEFNKVYGFEEIAGCTTKVYDEGKPEFFSGCWTRGTNYNNSGYYGTTYYYQPYVYEGGAYQGNNSLVMYSYSSYKSYFSLPAFATTQDMTEIIVTFYAKAESSTYNKLQVGTTSGISADGKTANFTQVGEEIQLSTSYDKKYEVKFENYKGADQLIMFYAANSSYSYPIYIDNIEIKKVACKPANPTISDRTANSATLSNGLTTGVDWAWKFEGAEDSTFVAGPAATTTISELTSDTEYKVFVQAQCSATEKSEWKSVTFRTKCDAQAALGYKEDFSAGMPTCTDSIGAECKNGEVQITAGEAFILPEFTSTDYSALQLTFKASTNSTSDPYLKIIAYAEGVELASQVVLDTKELAKAPAGVDVYFNEIEDINSKLAGKRVAFFREVGGPAVNIDDIEIKTASNFKAPKNLAKVADSETAEGASFTFDQSGDVKNVWVVEISTVETFTSIAKTDTIEAMSFTLTGLDMKKDYYVRVKQLSERSATAEVSNTSNVVKFTTECGKLALNTIYDMENYTAGTGYYDRPACWGFKSYYDSYKPSVYSSTTYNHTTGGTKSMKMQGYSTSTPTMFTMPVVDADIDMKSLTVTFWAVSSSSSGYDLKVGVLNSAETYSVSAFKVAETVKVTNDMTQYTVSFDELTGLTAAHKYITFALFNSSTYAYIYVDDIEVTSYCPKSEGAAASDVTASSATISITNATPDWNVVVKDGQTEVFSQDDIKTASVNVTGLSEETTYEAIITMNCAGGVVSDPDTIEFTTTATVWELVRDNLSQDQIGTTCLGKNITNVRGGVLYGVNYGTTKSIEFAEKQLPIAAGDPLLFQADGTNGGKLEVVYGSATATEALKDQGKDGVNGFVGLISGASVAIEEGNILVSGGKLHLTGTGCNLTAGHAYIKASELPTQSPAPVQGRRLVLTQNGTAVATGTDEVMINNLEGVQKIVRDGQLIIIRGGQLFNAQGQKL